jgi:cytochrome b
LVYGAEDHAGPLRGLFATGPGSQSAELAVFPVAEGGEEPEHRDDRNDDDDEESDDGEAEILEELHEFFANLTLWLVIFHVGGVLLASIVHRENLIAAMISGHKRAEPGETPEG